MVINQSGEFTCSHDFRCVVTAPPVRESEQMKLRRPQLVVDARAAEREVGHAVAGLDGKRRVAVMRAQRTGAVVDADL